MPAENLGPLRMKRMVNDIEIGGDIVGSKNLVNRRVGETIICLEIFGISSIGFSRVRNGRKKLGSSEVGVMGGRLNDNTRELLDSIMDGAEIIYTGCSDGCAQVLPERRVLTEDR